MRVNVAATVKAWLSVTCAGCVEGMLRLMNSAAVRTREIPARCGKTQGHTKQRCGDRRPYMAHGAVAFGAPGCKHTRPGPRCLR